MVNGEWIKSFAPSFTKPITINISPNNLQCGCENIVEGYGYNYGFASPMAIAYSNYQNCMKYMACKNLGATYYNLNTCQCECVSNCCIDPLVSYYPNCACMCPKETLTKCLRPKYFDRSTCKCSCVPMCCWEGAIQD
jgi:hypothetical protein